MITKLMTQAVSVLKDDVSVACIYGEWYSEDHYNEFPSQPAKTFTVEVNGGVLSDKYDFIKEIEQFCAENQPAPVTE